MNQCKLCIMSKLIPCEHDPINNCDHYVDEIKKYRADKEAKEDMELHHKLDMEG